jgi:hypothetical protein
MTDSASDKDKGTPTQKVPESTLSTDVGKFAEHDSIEKENKSKTEYQNAYDLLDKFKESIKRIRGFPGKYWKSLENAAVSNRTIAVATVVIAIATFLTYFEVRSGSTQTEKIIAADKRIANAMEGGLTQAQNAFTAANGQAILTQRAWITVKINAAIMLGPSPPPNPFILEKPFDIRISFRNTGRTPALNVKLVFKREGFVQKEGKFGMPNFSYKPDEYIVEGNLIPEAEVYGDTITKPLKEDDIKQVTSNQVRIFVHGRVEYDDVFGFHHWQSFCSFLLPTGAMAVCPENNDIDQNQPS